MRYYPKNAKEFHRYLLKELVEMKERSEDFDPYKDLDVEYAEISLLEDIVADLEFITRIYS